MKELEIFKDLPQVEAGFTTREYEAEEARDNLKEKGFLLARTKQVHKDQVGVVREQMLLDCATSGQRELVFPHTDALVTDCFGVALSTVHADCLPIWLYDEKSGAVGMAHAGWRGTCAGIAAKMARTMVQEFSGSFETMRAVVGPGIGFCCFEVGPEVYEAFGESYDHLSDYARKGPGDKFFLDLKGINEGQLRQLGVPTISLSPYCTSCSREEGGRGAGQRLFFSYRGEKGENPGQMTGYIYRK